MLVLAMEFSRSPTNGGEAASFVGTGGRRPQGRRRRFGVAEAGPKGTASPVTTGPRPVTGDAYEEGRKALLWVRTPSKRNRGGQASSPRLLGGTKPTTGERCSEAE